MEWKKKWITKIEYIDTETGEILHYNTVERWYEIINTEKTYKINEDINIRQLTHYCERKRQQELW